MPLKPLNFKRAESRHLLTAQPVLVVLDHPLQPARGVADRPEQLQLGVQLGVAGLYVLVLVLAQLPLHRLLRHPELVLNLVERRVVGPRVVGALLVGPPVVGEAAHAAAAGAAALAPAMR